LLAERFSRIDAVLASEKLNWQLQDCDIDAVDLWLSWPVDMRTLQRRPLTW